MVDKEARAKLRIALRRLVTGRMTNDQFDDLYYEHWIESEDRAVAQIGKFGYCLYSSDVGSYRLKGCYAVSPEERKAASRCILFLYTDQDFLWPSLADNLFFTPIAFLGRFGGLTAIALGIIAVPVLLMQDAFIIWLTLPSAVLISVIWVATRYLDAENSANGYSEWSVSVITIVGRSCTAKIWKRQRRWSSSLDQPVQ